MQVSVRGLECKKISTHDCRALRVNFEKIWQKKCEKEKLTNISIV